LALMVDDQPAADHAFSRALQAAKEVQEQQTATYWADFTVGECLLGQGKTEEALAEYTRSLQRHPAPPPFARDSALKGVLRMAELKNLGQEAAQRFRNLLQ
jgi:TolA-binding protein